MSSDKHSGGTLVISGASGGGQPPDRRQDKLTGHYAPDVGPFQPLTGIKMASPNPVRRPFLPSLPSSSQGSEQEMPSGRPRSNSAPMLLSTSSPGPFVAALDGKSVVGPTLGNIPQQYHRAINSSMSITDRGALGGMQRMGAPRRVDGNGNPLGITDNSLSQISSNTPIHLYGHGGFMGNSPEDPQPVFGNLSPQELSDQLIRGGLPNNYRGTLYANGCYTGIGGPHSFAFQLSRLLSSQGRYPTIRANLGPAHHFQDGTTGVLPLHRQEEHTEQTSNITTETVRLVHEAINPLTSQQRQQEITNRQRELTQESTRIEHEFYQRDPSVFVEFPPILPMPNRRHSFSGGDFQSLLVSQPESSRRRRNSIGGTQAPEGFAPMLQPPVNVQQPQQNQAPTGRPRSKSFSELPSNRKSKD